MDTKTKIIESSVGKMSITCLFLLLLGSAYAQHINVGYLRDVSVSATSTEAFDAKQKFKKVVLMLDLKDSNAGVNLRSSLIGTPGIPKVNVAILHQSGHFASVHERNNNLHKFLKKGLADFEYLAQPATHKQTQIFRSLVALIGSFEAQSDRTILIIESDFVESGSVAEFLKYKKNPAGLMSDFDKIITAFKADDNLPNLNGAEVILVTPGDSELAVWSARWWEKAMKYFGAKKVSIQASF